MSTDADSVRRINKIRRNRCGSSLAEVAAGLSALILLGFGLYDICVLVMGVMIQDTATKEVARALASCSGTNGGPGSDPANNVPGMQTVAQVTSGQVDLNFIRDNEVPRVVQRVESEYNKNPLYTFKVTSTDYNGSMPGFVIVKTGMTSHLLAPNLPFLHLSDQTTQSQACETITLTPFAGS